MKKAEFTAFLSITFLILISFVFGIAEISVIHVSGNMYRLDVDRALFSVFGEYHSQLLEDYRIFSLDSGYGTENYNAERILDRLHYYGTTGIEHEISGVQYMTDNEGQVFREQVLEYMNSVYGIDLIKEFTGLSDQWEEQVIQGNDMESRQEEIVNEIEDLKKADVPVQETSEDEEGTETEEGSMEDDPFLCLEQIEKEGILSVVMPEDMNLSGKSVDLAAQASVREKNAGFGSFPARQGMEDITNRLLFNEYILKFFSNASDREETEDRETSLEYEVEYILGGKSSDKENLESVLMKIFLIRMAVNYIYLQTDTGKQGEAGALAVVISSVLLMPEAVDAVKQLILLAWAAGESVVDIRGLLSGCKVAFIKDADSWQLSLSGLLTLGSRTDNLEGKDTEGGIDYKTYLRILLLFSDQSRISMRSIDRIEDNLRIIGGNINFRADQCITKIQLNNTAEIYSGLTYSFPAYFGYE